MKTEKDKEFDELIKKGKKMNKLEFFRLVFLSGYDVGKRERNTEVKQTINDIDTEKYIGEYCFKANTFKKELLQKLGLGIWNDLKKYFANMIGLSIVKKKRMRHFVCHIMLEYIFVRNAVK